MMWQEIRSSILHSTHSLQQLASSCLVPHSLPLSLSGSGIKRLNESPKNCITHSHHHVLCVICPTVCYEGALGMHEISATPLFLTSSGASTDRRSILSSLEIKAALLVSSPHLLSSGTSFIWICGQLSAVPQSLPPSVLAKNPLPGHFIIFCPHIKDNPEAGPDSCQWQPLKGSSFWWLRLFTRRSRGLGVCSPADRVWPPFGEI